MNKTSGSVLYFCKSCKKPFCFKEKGFSAVRTLPTGGKAMVYVCSTECAQFSANKAGKGCIIHHRGSRIVEASVCTA